MILLKRTTTLNCNFKYSTKWYRRGILPILLFASSFCYAQSIEKSVIGSTGDYFSSLKYQLEWTMGEVATEAYIVPFASYLQGFHHGASASTSVKERSKTVGVNIFPNPVSDYLKIDNLEINKSIIATFYDIAGRNVFEKQWFSSEMNQVNVESLEKGTYILRLNVSGKIESYVIIKS